MRPISNERYEIVNNDDYLFEHDDRGRMTLKTRRSDNADMEMEYDSFDNLVRVTLFDGTGVGLQDLAVAEVAAKLAAQEGGKTVTL